jgi:hypothetical protein
MLSRDRSTRGGETSMKRRSLVGTCVATALGLSLPANGAIGEQLQLEEQLVGTWMAVSWEQKKSDGTRLKQFGASPSGIAFLMRADDASSRSCGRTVPDSQAMPSGRELRRKTR